MDPTASDSSLYHLLKIWRIFSFICWWHPIVPALLNIIQFKIICIALFTIQSLQSKVIHGFVTEPWYSHHVWVSCERAASIVLEPCALSSAWLVSCGAWCSDPGTHVLSFSYVTGFGHLCSTFCLFVWVCMHSCYILCCVALSLCIHWLRACCHVLSEHVASVLVFCVPCAFMSICLDPTHLVTCLLINFPQLLSLVTLLICSL